MTGTHGNAAPSGGLAGLIVAEIAQTPGAAFAASLLADFNATVLICEPSGTGSPLRAMMPPAWWQVLGRNKRSVAIAPGEEGARLIRALLGRVDVVVTDVPPAAQHDYPWLRQLQDLPRRPLVVDLVPAGADRPDLWPWSVRADMTAAVCGLMALTGHPDREPIQPEFPLAEYLGGALAALRTVAELRRARLTNAPPLDVNLALHQAVFRMIEWQLPVASATGNPETRAGNAFPMNSGISNMHLTRDRKYFAISAANQASAVKLMEMIGGPELAQDPRFATIEARAKDIAPLYAIMDKWFAARTAEEVLKAAEEHDVVVGPILDADDILADAHYRGRGNIVEAKGADGETIRMPGIVPRISGIATHVENLGPPLGSDTARTIAEFDIGA